MTQEETEPYAGTPAFEFIWGNGNAYALIGTLVKNETPGGKDSYHLLAGGTLSRPIDERLVPLYEWFSTPRSETQVQEWLKWADAPDGFLKVLLKGRSLVRVKTSDAWIAAKSLRNLRLTPLSFPDFDTILPSADKIIAVKRTLESRDDTAMSIEMAEILWNETQQEDVPTAIYDLSKRHGKNLHLVAQHVLANLPDMLDYGYVCLEPMNIRGLPSEVLMSYRREKLGSRDGYLKKFFLM